MISTNDVKPGMALQLGEGLFQIVDYQHVKPGKGKAFVRMKLKNIESGAVIDRTFRADEDVDRAIVEKKDHQFLFRDDLSEIPGYLKVEAWPQPGIARVRITYDPKQTDSESIKEAIIEPYYDELQSFERLSPFEIEGYTPWEK